MVKRILTEKRKRERPKATSIREVQRLMSE